MQATIEENLLNLTEDNPVLTLFDFLDKKERNIDNLMDYQLQASTRPLAYPCTVEGGKVFANIKNMTPGKLYSVNYKKRKYFMKRDERGRLDVYELVK